MDKSAADPLGTVAVPLRLALVEEVQQGGIPNRPHSISSVSPRSHNLSGIIL